jgi:hypothetical protein
MTAKPPNPTVLQAGAWSGKVLGTGLVLLVTAVWVGLVAGIAVRIFRLVNGW